MKNTTLSMYRVYGTDGKDYIEEYIEASSERRAVERVKEWYMAEGKDYKVIEVAKVLTAKNYY